MGWVSCLVLPVVVKMLNKMSDAYQGTDIGGSVRIPAHIMGIYGFKPSSGRLPYEGVPVSTEGQEHVPSSVGPLGRSLSSIYEVTKLIAEAEPWKNDPRCHNMPWRQDLYEEIQSRPLIIGILFDDGVVQIHPPIRRVLTEIAAKLQVAGHSIVQWTADGHNECIEVMVWLSIIVVFLFQRERCPDC